MNEYDRIYHKLKLFKDYSEIVYQIILRKWRFFNAEGMAYVFRRSHDVTPSAFDVYDGIVFSTIITPLRG